MGKTSKTRMPPKLASGANLSGHTRGIRIVRVIRDYMVRGGWETIETRMPPKLPMARIFLAVLAVSAPFATSATTWF